MALDIDKDNVLSIQSLTKFAEYFGENRQQLFDTYDANCDNVINTMEFGTMCRGLIDKYGREEFETMTGIFLDALLLDKQYDIRRRIRFAARVDDISKKMFVVAYSIFIVSMYFTRFHNLEG